MIFKISSKGIDKGVQGLAPQDKGDIIRYNPLLYPVDVPRELLVGFLEQDQLWSPFIFRNNKRNQANAQLKTSLIVFDVDNNTDYEVIKRDFLQLFDHIILMPSGGLTPDYQKYRIIIPFESNIEFMSNHHYKMVMNNIKNKLTFEVDEKCLEMGRCFFAGANSHKKSFDTGGTNPSSTMIPYLVNQDESFCMPKRPKKNRYKNSQIEPKHLLKNPIYKKYLNDIQSGNYHNGEIALMGYLRKSECLVHDIEQHIIELRGSTGSNPSPEQHRNRISILK